MLRKNRSRICGLIERFSRFIHSAKLVNMRGNYMKFTDHEFPANIKLLIFSYLSDDAVEHDKKEKVRCFLLIPILQKFNLFKTNVLIEMTFSCLSGGLTNATYKLRLADQDRVLRITTPCNPMINRKYEEKNGGVAETLGVNLEILASDAQGNQLTVFLENSIQMDKDGIMLHLPLVMRQFHRLHDHSEKVGLFANAMDIFERNAQWLRQAKKQWPGRQLPDDYSDILTEFETLSGLIRGLNFPLVRCHADPNPTNFLLFKAAERPEDCRLIDFEYAGNFRGGDIIDLAYLTLYLEPPDEKKVVTEYLKNTGRSHAAFEAAMALFKPALTFWIYLWYRENGPKQTTLDKQENFNADAIKYLRMTRELIASERYRQAKTPPSLSVAMPAGFEI